MCGGPWRLRPHQETMREPSRLYTRVSYSSWHVHAKFLQFTGESMLFSSDSFYSKKKLLLVSLQVHSTLLLLYFILFHFTWLSLVDLRLCPGHLRFWVTSRISNWFTAFKTSEMLLYFRLSWLNLFYSTPLLSCHRGFTPLLSACSACVWLREPTHVIGSSRHHKVNRFQSLSIWIKGNELEMPTWFWSADKKIFR